MYTHIWKEQSSLKSSFVFQNSLALYLGGTSTKGKQIQVWERGTIEIIIVDGFQFSLEFERGVIKMTMKNITRFESFDRPLQWWGLHILRAIYLFTSFLITKVYNILSLLCWRYFCPRILWFETGGVQSNGDWFYLVWKILSDMIHTTRSLGLVYQLSMMLLFFSWVDM